MRLIDVTMGELRDMIREVVREELERSQATKGPEPSSILTTEEAAVHARRSPETIRDWIKSGRLRALPRSGRQHYRIQVEELAVAMRAPDPSLDAEAWAEGLLARHRVNG